VLRLEKTAVVAPLVAARRARRQEYLEHDLLVPLGHPRQHRRSPTDRYAMNHGPHPRGIHPGFNFLESVYTNYCSLRRRGLT
jgi:hypothetical protein